MLALFMQVATMVHGHERMAVSLLHCVAVLQGMAELLLAHTTGVLGTLLTETWTAHLKHQRVHMPTDAIMH